MGEWAECGNFRFRVNSFYSRCHMEYELWNITIGENLSEDEFYAKAGGDIPYKHLIVNLSVVEINDEPQTFDF